MNLTAYGNYNGVNFWGLLQKLQWYGTLSTADIELLKVDTHAVAFLVLWNSVTPPQKKSSNCRLKFECWVDEVYSTRDCLIMISRGSFNDQPFSQIHFS